MNGFTSLTSCLVEGDSAAVQRARRARRQALLFSAAGQAGLLLILLIAPMLATAELRERIFVPPGIVFRGFETPAQAPPAQQPPQGRRRQLPPGKISFVQPQVIPPTIAANDDGQPVYDFSRQVPGESVPQGIPNGFDAIASIGTRSYVPPPPEKSSKASESRPVRISEGVLNGLLVHRVQPKYPPIAVQLRLEGAVLLRAVIGRDGRVKELEILSGHPLLIEAALKAIWQWRYQPTLLNGEPVEVESLITVKFALNR